jgi:hypothetical protein
MAAFADKKEMGQKDLPINCLGAAYETGIDCRPARDRLAPAADECGFRYHRMAVGLSGGITEWNPSLQSLVFQTTIRR